MQLRYAVMCQHPSSQSELYSHYKSTHTFKGLVGVSPNGLVTFLSELFAESDRECVIQSQFLDLEFDKGDSVMANKGFCVEDLLQKKGGKLKLAAFLAW